MEHRNDGVANKAQLFFYIGKSAFGCQMFVPVIELTLLLKQLSIKLIEMERL